MSAGKLNDEADSQAHARVGDVLNDKWTLERLLGTGGMGAVYAGRHRNGARAAVKVLHRYLSQHEEVRARFLREGYAANRVDRPGVVKVLDDDVVVGGRDDGTAYLVMELLEGQSLEARADSGWRVTERQFLAIADAVLDVLDAAHTNGVVHRDIKPDNLFIARDETGAERIKVLDFGLARLLEGRSTTTYGIAIGTPSFMSPEQASGRNDEIDGRTDLFALAASGFRLVTGRRLHEGSSPIDVMSKMATLPAPRVRTVAPQTYSEPFARVIDRALEFRREDRYESAAAMRTDVQAALAALEVLELGSQPTAMMVAVPEKSTELSVKAVERSSHSSQQATVSDAPSTKPSQQSAQAPRPTASAEPSRAATVIPGEPVSLVSQPDTVREEPAAVQSQPVAVPSEPLPVLSQPASAAPLPLAADQAQPPPAPHYPEESLAEVPMQRVSLVPAVAIVLALGTVGALAYAGIFSHAAPAPPVAPVAAAVAADVHDADVASRDADLQPRRFSRRRCSAWDAGALAAGDQGTHRRRNREPRGCILARPTQGPSL